MEPDNIATFGAVLRRYRIMANLSQAALAERAGLSTAAITTLERGIRQSPRLETVRLLAEALDLDEEQRERLSAAARQLPSAASVTPPSLVAHVPGNVPRPLSRCVGRADAITDLQARLRHPTTRLLTLVGPPGVGKTRLSIEVAMQMQDDFPDGVFWVALATLQEPALVLTTIAQTLGHHGVAGVPLIESVCAFLRQKRLLLLLDNFEQVVAAAPIIADIVGRCSQVVALVTSRAPLHIQGEQEYAVAPLVVPDQDAAMSFMDIQAAPAVTLFVQRAQAIKPDFLMTAAMAPSIAAICQRLDGLPLAIELAAARVKMLPVQNLLARLESRLGILTGGSQDMAVHQQTLRTTLAWSYHLLTPYAQRVFRQIAVFAGGTTLHALKSVLADGEDNLLDGVAHLIDHSLVVPQEHQEEARFDLLETIREYGLEVLAQSGELADVQQRYVDYYLSLAEATWSKLSGKEEQTWFDRLEVEQGNFRVVLHYYQTTGDFLKGLQLCATLWYMWQRRNFFTEGRQWLEIFLALSAHNDEPRVLELRAKALYAAGTLAWPQGDFERARIALAESLAIHQQMNNAQGAASALNTLGVVAIFTGEVEQARQHLEASLALRRTLPDQVGLARTLNDLGQFLRQHGDETQGYQLLEESVAISRDANDVNMMGVTMNNLGLAALRRHAFDQAQQFFTESLTLSRSIGNTRSVAVGLKNLGELAYVQHDYTAARHYYTESLLLCRKLGDKQGIAKSLRDLGNLDFAEAALEAAAEHYQDSLLLSQEMGEKSGIVDSLEMIAHIAVTWGHHERAVALFAAAATMREAHNLLALPPKSADIDQAITGIRAQMSDGAFAEAWSRGQMWSLDTAIQTACQLTR